MARNDRLPNFLLAGASKAGSTSLYHALRQHPDIYMPEEKEPGYFIADRLLKVPAAEHFQRRHLIVELEQYERLFDGVAGERAIGEASVQYLMHPDLAIPGIRALLGDVSILLILRNPVDRAISSYSHILRDRGTSESLGDVLDNEAMRLDDGSALWLLVEAGRYSRQVAAYQAAFSRVKVVLLDDLKADASGVFRDVFGFLGVADDFVPTTIDTVMNPSGVPRLRWLQWFLTPRLVKRSASGRVLLGALKPFLSKERRMLLINKMRHVNLRRYNASPEDRARLQQIFQEEIDALEPIIGRDLSAWRGKQPQAAGR